MTQDWEYQVALSFAGEQRAYVERVSKELTKLGIHHFYDNDNQSSLWGKNLTRYLDDIYFAKSRFVVAFISKEYRDKIWTKWEMNSAQDRAMRQPEEYLLPVYFDDIRLSGLVGSLGHIDARTTSPEELAHLIYEKVSGRKTASDCPDTTDLPYHSPNLPYVDFYKEERLALQQAYDHSGSSKALTILGEKGLGKSTVVNMFLDGKFGVIHISPNRDPHYQLEPLVDALGNSWSFFDNSSDLMLPERLKKHILDLCRKTRVILYFEGMDQYNDGLISFILDLTREILLRHPEYRTTFLFEYDTDSEHGNDLAKQLSGLPPFMLDFIPFNRLSSENLSAYLEQVYGEVKIDTKDKEYILNSSYGNIMYLNTIINYLRMKGILTKSDNQFVCSHISDGALTDILGAYILQRYNRLNSDLREVLSKSAIIGNTFSSELLSKPFGILHAQELLDKIESISMLIKREDEASYSFESPDSFRIISAFIKEDERRQWHHILAKYFSRRLDHLKSSHLPYRPEQEIVCLHSAARHYKFSEEYGMALGYYFELAQGYLEISDYENARKAISETRALLDLVDFETIPIKDIEFHLAILEAHCMVDMGEYSKALTIYLNCLAKPPEEIDQVLYSTLKLDVSLCHYMNGETSAALTLAEQVKSELEKSAPDSQVYCRSLSLLASYNDCTGKGKEKQQYYIQALTICRAQTYEDDYYNLLKKASMVYDETLAVGMYPAVEEYFESKHQIKNMAELQHNIATDYLYLAEQDKIPTPLNKSIELFSTFGSSMIHYPLNTKGIYQALFEGKYNDAIKTFQYALSYQPECYSQIVLKANMASCCLAIGDMGKAKELLGEIDELITLPINSDVYDYQIYQSLMWSLLYYKSGKYELCIASAMKCINLRELEPRFHYMATTMVFLAKSKMSGCLQTPIEQPPKPVLWLYHEREVLFFSLRFYE